MAEDNQGKTPSDPGADTEQLQRDLKKAMREAATRPLSEDEIYYLLGRYPYLEICDASITEDKIVASQPLNIFRSQAGWMVFDDGNMLRSSQSELIGRLVYMRRIDDAGNLIKPTPEQESEDGEGSGGLVPPAGTIVGQFVSVAEEMILRAMERWPDGVRILSGYYPMMRAAWIAGKTRGYAVSGFEPTAEDNVVLHWAESVTPDAAKRTTPGPKKGR